MKYHFSPKLTSLLESIKHPLAEELLNLRNKDTDKLNYFDYNESYEITYLSKKFFDNVEHLDLKSIYESDEISKLRQETRIGRLAYALTKHFSKSYIDSEFEKFTNIFKSKIFKNECELKIVKGDEIDFWYDYKNYSDDIESTSKSSLYNSCMKKTRDVFSVYKESNCSLLCLIKDNKLVGRALLWENIDLIKGNGERIKINILDKTYTTHQFIEEIFYEYAFENNFYYKTLKKFVGKESEIMSYDVEVYIPVADSLLTMKKPYMDTFKYLNEKYENGTIINCLSNKKNNYNTKEYWNLTTGTSDKKEYYSIAERMNHLSVYLNVSVSEIEFINYNTYLVNNKQYYVGHLYSLFSDNAEEILKLNNPTYLFNIITNMGYKLNQYDIENELKSWIVNMSFVNNIKEPLLYTIGKLKHLKNNLFILDKNN